MIELLETLVEMVLAQAVAARSVNRRLSLQTVAIARMNARLKRVERLERDRSVAN